jgi:hypothetical protein
MAKETAETLMISFYGEKPSRINHLCKQCIESCKQHRDMMILRCPSFVKKAKGCKDAKSSEHQA